MNRRLLILGFIILLIVSIAAVAILLLWKPDSLEKEQSYYTVENAFPNLTFSAPVGIAAPGDGTNRLFVIEQAGTIKVFDNANSTETVKTFLDLSSQVLYGGEQGLLGMAFHPDYRNNGYFYVNYVTASPRRTIIDRYQVSASNPDQAELNSQLILLEIEQPFSNHNGGQLAFGADGYLYIGLGDGGSQGDPFGNGQNQSSLLGKILRIDVDSLSTGANYGIPLDNPFVGNTLGYREEIYAYGFRNPWRFSFDPSTGRLWVADVGQSQREEINVVEKGKNYGWNLMEGSLPFSSGSQAGLELPVWEYGREEGIAVIGGYVYRGSAVLSLSGKYIYGDYGSGKIWALQYDGENTISNNLLVDTALNISSFGIDDAGELYLCALDGKIYSLRFIVVPE